jgi:hypothetical protein
MCSDQIKEKSKLSSQMRCKYIYREQQNCFTHKMYSNKLIIEGESVKDDARCEISVYLVMGLGRKVHFSQRMSRVTEMMSAPATPNTVLRVSRLK